MKVEICNNIYDLPTISQCTHRYSREVYCNCETQYKYDTYIKTVENWEFDGIYDSTIGRLICFTCPVCGDKFMFHARDLKTWFNYGFFDKYKI